jgi:FHA domain
MALTCPKGHVSVDPDYCSECGAKLVGAASAITPETAIPPELLAAAAGGEPCPVCATRRVIGARFCEVCRYDFQTASPAPAAPAQAADDAASPAAQAPDAPLSAAAPAATSAIVPITENSPVPCHWDVIIAVDPTLCKNPDPAQPCPEHAPERTFPLDLDENLIGRHSDRRDVHPVIAVSDPGISRRHLTLRRRPDGGFLALELGSTNGTSLNSIALEPGIPTPLKDGDQMTLGCWTRITVRAR